MSGLVYEDTVRCTGGASRRQTLNKALTKGKLSALWLPIAVVLVILLLLEFLTRSGAVSENIVPPPSIILTTLLGALADPGTWAAAGQTLGAALGGFLIATLIGIPVGLLLGFNWFLRESTRAIIEFMRPVPPMALLPLAVLLLGTGVSVKLALVVFGAFFPIMIQSIAGAREVDPVTRETGKVYGLSAVQQIRSVLLPSAAPNIATGLRLGVIVSQTVVVATELVVGSEGLGYAINQARFAGLAPRMYALILLTGIIGYLISTLFRVLEKRALAWHVSTRQGDFS